MATKRNMFPERREEESSYINPAGEIHDSGSAAGKGCKSFAE